MKYSVQTLYFTVFIVMNIHKITYIFKIYFYFIVDDNQEDIDGNIIDVKFISFSSHRPFGKEHEIGADEIIRIPLDTNGQRRDELYRRDQKPINYPVKDLFPKDRDEESGSGSGDGMFLTYYSYRYFE